jgi:hypothetical protein
MSRNPALQGCQTDLGLMCSAEHHFDGETMAPFFLRFVDSNLQCIALRRCELLLARSASPCAYRSVVSFSQSSYRKGAEALMSCPFSVRPSLVTSNDIVPH